MKIERKRKIGDRVCGNSHGNCWGTIVGVRDIRDNAKTHSQKMLNAKRKYPYVYTITWDAGRTEEFRPCSVHSLWQEGDVNLKGQELVDPKSKP